MIAGDYADLYKGLKTYLRAGPNVSKRLAIIHGTVLEQLIDRYGSLNIQLALKPNPRLTMTEVVNMMDEGYRAFKIALAHGEIRRIFDPAFAAERNALLCAEGYNFCFDVWAVVVEAPIPPDGLAGRPLEAGDWVKLSHPSLHWVVDGY